MSNFKPYPDGTKVAFNWVERHLTGKIVSRDRDTKSGCPSYMIQVGDYGAIGVADQYPDPILVFHTEITQVLAAAS